MARDIRIATDFPNHPKTLLLMRKVGDRAVHALLSLWCYAANNRPDGSLAGLDNDEIAAAAHWDGPSDPFVAALVKVRYLDGEPGAYCLHDWATHQPWIIGEPERKAKASMMGIKSWEVRKSKAAQVPASITSPDASSTASSKARRKARSSAASNAPFLSFPFLAPNAHDAAVRECEGPALLDPGQAPQPQVDTVAIEAASTAAFGVVRGLLSGRTLFPAGAVEALDKCAPVAGPEGHLTISAPDRYTARRISGNYLEQIKAALSDAREAGLTDITGVTIVVKS